MTTGFDYIFGKMFQSRRNGATMLKITVTHDTYGMLKELAREQGTSIEKLAMDLIEKEVIRRYENTSEYEKIWQSLSERQQEVAALACLGFTNGDIEEILNISLGTVKTHIRDIFKAFDVRGRHQLTYMLRKWDFSNYDPKNRPQ
ncbi:MAG: response regulator transcription factor [Anaerolineales bacterium]|nr:response regulator transcription factor [Chloroflexota bacterium]MBL6983479.1 response regulator transcription factor [Anaerolineales bacterium]